MLFSDIADWNFNTAGVADRNAEEALCQKNAFRVMAERAVAEVGEKRLRFVKPAMDRKVVLWFATEFLGADLCVFYRVGHGHTSYVVVV
jgi:hypothetical protein